jgi:hypothetical protein
VKLTAMVALPHFTNGEWRPSSCGIRYSQLAILSLS